MKRVLGLGLVLVIVLNLLAACGGGSTSSDAAQPVGSSGGSSKTYEFKLATTVQEAMPAGRAAEIFCNDVLEKSDGRINIGYYPNSQLGSAEELMAQVVDGTLDIGQISFATASGYADLLEVIQVPFLLTDNESMKKAYTSEEIQAIFDAVEEELGVKILCMAEHGSRVIANNVRPVRTPDDMKGLKMRSSQNGACFETLTALGASPVGLTYKEVYSALDSNVIDGEEINFTSMYAEAHYEVLKYVTDVVLWPFPAINIMSGKAWNSLDPEDQAILEECSQSCLENNFQFLEEYEAEAKQVLADAGLEILEDVDPAPFQERVASIREEYRAKNDYFKNFIEMVEAM